MAKKAQRKESKAKKTTPSTKGKSKLGNSETAETVAVQSKGGRPSKFTQAIVDEICERLSTGEPLAQICRDEHMPHPTTVRDWMAAKEDVSLAIAQARENGEDMIAADCLNIADDNSKDTRFTEAGVEVVNPDVVQRAKLRIETRLKLLAKWNPKKWGDKVDVTSAGERIRGTEVILPNVQQQG